MQSRRLWWDIGFSLRVAGLSGSLPVAIILCILSGRLRHIAARVSAGAAIFQPDASREYALMDLRVVGSRYGRLKKNSLSRAAARYAHPLVTPIS